MGVCIAPYIFQEQMSALMDDLDFFRVYLENVLIITSGSFEENLAKVEEVMKQLQLDRLKCKIDKCKSAVPKKEYLGYIITREGIKLDPKKSEAIINIERPKDKKQPRKFLGMSQYYRDLWTECSDILAPLMELTKGVPTKNGPMEWTPACAEAF